MESKREAGVENKFVRSLLYGMALNLSEEEINRIVNVGTQRVEEMSSDDVQRLSRQVPKVVRMFGSLQTPTPTPSMTAVKESTPSSEEAILDGNRMASKDEELILHMTSCVEAYKKHLEKVKAPSFFLKRKGDYMIVITGLFEEAGDTTYNLNGSIGGSRNIAVTNPDYMFCLNGKPFSVSSETRDASPFEKVVIWAWATKIVEKQKIRLWVNKKVKNTNNGDLKTLSVVLTKSFESGFIRS